MFSRKDTTLQKFLTLVVHILLCVLTLSQLSCKKHTTEPKHTAQTKIDYFPNEVGSQWKYSRFDSLSNVRDTITITIVDTTTINGMKMKIWQYISSKDSAYIQSKYVGILHDTIWFNSPYVTCSEGLPLPFTIGTITSSFDDSISVIQQDSISVPAGQFDTTYQIYLRCWCGDECGQRSNIWFSHNIGFVKIVLSSYDWPPPHYRKELWELISYHLIPPK